MKKIMNLFVLVAAAAVAHVSCQKPENDVQIPEGCEYTLLIGNADQPEDVDSKALVGDDCVTWEVGDRVGTFTKTSVNKYSEVKSVSPATLSVYAQGGSLAVGEMLYFYYPYVTGDDTQKEAVEMSIPAEQDGDDEMPMVSLPHEVTTASSASQTEYAGVIRFANLGAVIEFALFTEDDRYASEVVKSVSFEAEQAIAGSFTFNLTQVDYSDADNTLKIGTDMTENTIVVSAPAGLTVGTRENPSVVRMVVAPGTYSGKFVVNTNAAKYTFAISDKTFGRSTVKPFSLNLREEKREETPADVWTLVTSVDNMPDGEYVILAKHANASGYGYLPSTTTTSAAPKYVQQTVFDAVTSVVVPTSVDKAMVWNFAQSSGKWTITSPDGKYFYGTSSNNGLRVGTTEDTWTITVNAYNSSAFTMQGTKNSRFVGVYSNTDWRSYDSASAQNYGSASNGYQNAQLFFYYHGALTAKPGVTVSDVEVSARGGENLELAYTLVNPDGSTVAAEPDGTIVTAATIEGDKVVYTVSPNKTTSARNGSITITYGEVEKVVTVAQLAPVFTSTVEEIVLEATAGADKSFTITSDFDWTATLSEGAGFTVSPESYTWSETGKQSVKVTANAANDTEGVNELGTVTFTSEAGAELVVTVKQETSFVAEGTAEEILTFYDRYSADTSLSGSTVSAENFNISFASNGGSATKYYTNGTSVRVYAKNSFTVSSDKTITGIELIFGSGDGSNTITVDGGIYSNGAWSGSANSVVFTIGGSSGNRRIAGIKVSYIGSTSGGETPDPTPDPDDPDQPGTGGGNEDDSSEPVTIDVTFGDYPEGTQYGVETHEINEVLTLYTNKCHFTSELRIYSSSTNNGYVTSNKLPGVITKMSFNAGNKTDTLNVYGSTDGSTWTLVKGVSITSTSYKDYSLDFSGSYTYFKLDVAGSNQVRLKTLSVTYQPAN